MSDSNRNFKCEEIFQMLREERFDEIAALGVYAIPYLLASMDVFDHDLGEAGKKALAMIRPGNPKHEDVETLIPKIAANFTKPNVFVKAEASRIFAKIGVCALPDLHAMLQDENSDIRSGAVNAIRWIAKGNPRDPYLVAIAPTLIDMAVGRDWSRVGASLVLKEMNDPQTNERLYQLMMDPPFGDISARAQLAITTIGEPMAARLVGSLHDPNPYRRNLAQDSLKEMADKGRIRLPELREYLRHVIETERASGDKSRWEAAKAYATERYFECCKKLSDEKSRMFEDGEILYSERPKPPKRSDKDMMFRSGMARTVSPVR